MNLYEELRKEVEFITKRRIDKYGAVHIRKILEDPDVIRELPIDRVEELHAKACALETGVVNLTPHTVKIRPECGGTKVYPPYGVVARVSVDRIPDGEIDGVPVHRTVFDAPTLPDSMPGVTYIVSSLVRSQCPDCEDLVSPDTSPQSAIRDDKGRIIAVKGFQR